MQSVYRAWWVDVKGTDCTLAYGGGRALLVAARILAPPLSCVGGTHPFTTRLQKRDNPVERGALLQAGLTALKLSCGAAPWAGG